MIVADAGRAALLGALTVALLCVACGDPSERCFLRPVLHADAAACQRLCEQGGSESYHQYLACERLGDMVRAGVGGLKPDRKKVFDLYDRACKLGNTGVCESLRQGRYGPRP